MIHLLKTRRFAPIFWVQFFGAFNDNFFKNALVMLVTFKTAKEEGWNPDVVVPLTSAMLLLPYALFGSIAGQLCDKYDKAKITHWVKFYEIGIMLVASYGFMANRPLLLLFTLFAMGTHSTFFGPIKYGILPQHLKENELMGGAGLIEASTFMAILGGTIWSGCMMVQENGVYVTSGLLPWMVMGTALVGWAASFFVPSAPSSDPGLKLEWNLWQGTRHMLKESKRQTRVWRAILGLSWFWTVGALWLTILPVYVKDILHQTPEMLTQFLAMFCVGIGFGAMATQWLNKGEITAKWVPLAGLGLSLFTAAFVWLQSWVDVDQFAILSPIGFGLCFCLFGVAFTGGLFSTPLYAGLQAWSDPEHRSRNVAANNIMNSVFIVTASGVVAILAVLGFDWAGRLLILAGLNVLASLYIISLVPEGVVQTVGRMILRILFRVKVHGLEHYAAARPRKVIIANHVSYLDAVILSAFLPEIPTFAIDTRIARVWWIRPALTFIRAFPLDTAKPMAIKSLTKLVQQGTPVVIFPEGRLTMTGGLMKMYQGPGTMALHGDADIVPVWLDGVQYSLVSQLKDKKRLSWFPKITMTIMPPVRLEKPAGTGRAGRAQVVNKIYGLMTEMSYRATPIRTTLFSALIEAGRKHGPTREAVNDPKFHPLTYRQLIARARTLATKLEARMTGNDPVGLLLPNSVAGVTALFALQAAGRVTAMLNYSIGAKNLRSACTTARIRHVWTSEEFVRVAKLQPLVEVLEMDGVKVHYLESQQKERTCWDVARYLVYSSFPKWGLPQPHELEVQSLQPAVILFTSGSSGTPKAVVLSHHNLLANQAQLLARIDFNAQDRVFNCLPVFHSFGLTGGTLAPLFAGVRVFLYPSPLHYGMIPEMVYQTSCTILFGTNTFLSGYSRKAHPYDFYSVRYVFAGAEKIRENTKRVWAETFGIRILEGYGSTECSPVIATNTPMYNQSGTVGQFLPGLEWRLEPVSGINSGGRLWVKGENIMLGYYLPENPGVLQSPHDGWYDTGDIVEVTNEGFVRILGRAKRFAKVAGEMVSLTAVEELASQACPGCLHVAVAVANEGKGEEIILVTESESLTRAEVLASAQSQGISALAVPSKIVPGRVPLLASGKPDYVAVQEWVTKRTAIA